jgi:hypothetical protein
LSERKNEEKTKNYARDNGHQESKKNEHKRCVSSIRPCTFRQQRSSNPDERNNKKKDHDHLRDELRSILERGSFSSQYQSFFYGYCFTCSNFRHKVVDCRAYGRNSLARDVYVAPYNIESYKCHNYGHIAHDCRSMMESSLKENIDIIYKKVWRIKKKQEEWVNEELPKIILTGFADVQDHGESTGKEEDVRIQKNDPIADHNYIPFYVIQLRDSQ